MKPTPQININQPDSRRDSRARRNDHSPPLTDYFYQSTARTSGSRLAISEDAHRISKRRMFWKLSSDFFGAETSRDYAAELTIFALIAGVSAWPIISMLGAVYRLIK